MDSLENPYNLDLSCAKSNPKRMSKSMTIKIETQIENQSALFYLAVGSFLLK